MENNPTLLFVVAAALIGENNKILMQTRPLGRSMAGLWEFPGGKVEADEKPERALARELYEELNVQIDTQNLVPTCFASQALGKKHLLLLLYICREWSGDINAREGQHYDWFKIEDMADLDMPPADIPLVANLHKILSDG